MSKMISIRYNSKKSLENKPQEIAKEMFRVLPYMIEQEIKTTSDNNKKLLMV